MCHERFVVELGPRINFIIGHNGSGKSAVLTAILVCLGTKASVTNRGSKLKSLIREGESSTKIIIRFSNQGDDAFRLSDFGESITVERVIRREGSSGYSLKDAWGKIVSTKREDLRQMMEHFGIVVDNPMAFLSQDTARSFLADTTDEMKYEYFMRGSHLQDSHNNYSFALENVRKSQSEISSFKDTYNHLRAERESKREKFELSRQNDNLRFEYNKLQGKLYWSYVEEYERKLSKTSKACAMITSKIQSQKESIDRTQEEIEALETEIGKFATVNSEQYTTAKNFHDEQVEPAKEKLSEKRRTLAQLKSNVDTLNQGINRDERDIKRLNYEAEKEQNRLNKLNEGGATILSDRIEKLKIEKKEKDTEISELEKQMYEMVKDSRDLQEKMQSIAEEIRSKRRTINDNLARIDDINQSKNDSLAPFGRNIQSVMNEIDRQHWVSKPKGPVGRYVNIKPEFKEWRTVLDAQLSRSLDSFTVTNGQDNSKLRSILKKYGLRNQIVMRKEELTDFSQGLPDSKYSTIFDALDISDEFVKRFLIDSNRIESTLLIKNRQEGDSEIHSNPLKVVGCISLDDTDNSSGYFIMNKNGSSSSTPINGNPQNLPKISSSSNSKVETIKNIEKFIEDEKADIRQLELEHRRLSSQRSSQAQGPLKTELTKTKARRQSISQEIDDLQAKIADVDDGRLLSIKAQIDNKSTQLEIKQSQLRELKDDKIPEEIENLEDLQKRLVEVEIQEEEYKEDYNNSKKILEDKSVEKIYKEKEKASKVKAVGQYEDALKDGREKEQIQEQKLQKAKVAAVSKVERTSVELLPNETSRDISDKLDAVERQLRNAELLLDASHERIVEEYNEAETKYKQAELMLKQLKENEKLLSEDLELRERAFQESRNETISRASVEFSASLAQRGFEGRLDFDNVARRLRLVVHTGSDANSSARKTNSLSGGEKSFAQICLLLAIWKPMMSRIRGLDEFDVFMDSVNRELGMKLMIESLRQEANAQTIFITPQAMGNAIKAGVDVKIIRVQDPRRHVNSDNRT